MPMEIFTMQGATVTRTVTTTTASVALTTRPEGGGSVRVFNLGPNKAFIEFGTSTIEATVAASMPIPSGGVEVFELGPKITHVAAISAAAESATIYCTNGQGA